jgi:hypothetical protein
MQNAKQDNHKHNLAVSIEEKEAAAYAVHSQEKNAKLNARYPWKSSMDTVLASTPDKHSTVSSIRKPLS